VRVDHLDHLVLTVADIDKTIEFYTHVLGMRAVTFGSGRRALEFGTSKINLHLAAHELEPKAARPTPGSADLCLIVDDSIEALIEQLGAAGVPVEEGPVDRTGATGPIRSIYVRDPDGNLIELSNYPTDPPRPSVEFVHVDVFADGPYSGNSLAVLVDSGNLDDAQMLAITQELRHFETIFVTSTSDPSIWRARVFDQTRELPFAGHPVLGAAAVLHSRSRTEARSHERSWQMMLPAKTVTVKTRVGTAVANDGYLADLDQGTPEFGQEVHDRISVARAYGLDLSDLSEDLPLRVVSTGLRYLVVPVGAGALAKARVVEDLTAIVRSAGADFAVLFDEAALEVRTWDNDGLLEDIATGSAAGVIGAYRLRCGLAVDGETFDLHQGQYVGRPSVLRVRVHGTVDKVERVAVSGAVAMVGRGVVLVP
jgi:PhzF family phenazine biosynthesis protein